MITLLIYILLVVLLVVVLERLLPAPADPTIVLIIRVIAFLVVLALLLQFVGPLAGLPLWARRC